MKKSMFKKLIVLAAVAAMAMAMFSGCGKDASKQLSGTWALTYDMGSIANEEVVAVCPDFDAPLEIDLCFDFKEDGTFRFYIDEETSAASFEAWKDALTDACVQMVYQELAGMGYDAAKADEMVQQTYGMSIEEYTMDQMGAAFADIDISTLFADAEQTGTFTAKGDLLMLNAEGEGLLADNFEVDGDTLTLTIPEDSDEETEIMEGLSYPLVFKKK